MKKILIIFLTFLFTTLSLASDEKPGRFFEDQPDVEEYSTHIIYLPTKDEKDKEWDVNGKIEKLIFKVNKDAVSTQLAFLKQEFDVSTSLSSRVLIELNPELRPALKAAGQLTRDPRSVERKKFGHKKARRSFQFSKR